MKEQVKNIVSETFKFLIDSYFSNNVVEHINQHVQFNEKDRIFSCSAAVKSMNMFKKEKDSPVLYVHSSSVFSEAVSFWFHGHNCAEILDPISIDVEFDNQEHVVHIVYNKETGWFEISGNVFDIIWKKTKFSFMNDAEVKKPANKKQAA